ncbi:MAG: putative soluble lytic transglycosylase fused to an ABC-type amino acid-binding protein [Rhodocyclaceae bacterium]|nr:MAG: putative soluble lytic transglycosylase fused to an ABC-type amino acid-binding protein [Rhodocyclaceae bacterium]
MSKLLRLICCLASVGLAACTRIEPPEADGRLVVAVRETPAFFQQREGATASGFEHDLVTAFADSLGLKLRFIKAVDAYELSDLALAGRVHIAASMPLGNGTLQFSMPIRTVTQWIVGHDDVLGPQRLADLAGRSVEVMAGSPLADTLRGLDEKSRPLVIEVPGVDEMELLARVAEHKAELAAVHEVHLDLGVNFYPELVPLLQLPGKLEIGWAFGGEGAAALRAKADAFITTARADGTLARIHDRYFGHIKRINAAGIAQFLDDTRSKLPNWRRHFQSAQDLTGIDWRLLAALAYQESHWDPLATSPTGVRGMMMLTEDTADHLRVKNRLDAQESIRAGARYLAELVEQVPASAKHPDRLWLALSAYNLGMGHFRGARAIAMKMKRDPDIWYDMKQVLPQLARPEIYARLKSGAARGGEAVIMVENIRSYYDILSRFEPAYASPYPAQSALTVNASPR